MMQPLARMHGQGHMHAPHWAASLDEALHQLQLGWEAVSVQFTLDFSFVSDCQEGLVLLYQLLQSRVHDGKCCGVSGR